MLLNADTLWFDEISGWTKWKLTGFTAEIYWKLEVESCEALEWLRFLFFDH